ncbi:Ionotropic glutamate receptor L-glutamate and glycine-binding domain [Trinorchestia longiramus]|nr:Ionotropic glutamate receptor L-glutamate and glycine-binding domain [Trinorchestia longiramus]
MLSQQMNFTYSLHNACDSNFGSQLPNGSWTGVLKELVEGQADLALANIGFSIHRSLVADYPSVAMTFAGAGILVKEVGQEHNIFGVYLEPFSRDVWLCTFFTIPVSAVFLCITSKWRNKESLGKHEKLKLWQKHLLKRHQKIMQAKREELGIRVAWETSEELPLVYDKHQRSQKLKPRQDPLNRFAKSIDNLEDKQLSQFPPRMLDDAEYELSSTDDSDPSYSFPSGVWVASTVLLQQGQYRTPKNMAARQVFGLMWVLSLVLYASYTSNLVSFLTVTNPSVPISNLKELVESEMEYGTRDGSVYIENFKNSDNPVHLQAYAQLSGFSEHNFMNSYDDALIRVRNGSYAFIADYPGQSIIQYNDLN